jgi:hypothetical protein
MFTVAVPAVAVKADFNKKFELHEVDVNMLKMWLTVI